MTLYQIALQAAEQVNIPVELIYAQLKMESANGTSELASAHNYAGITTSEPNDWAKGDGLYWKKFESDEHFANYYANFIAKFGVSGVKTAEEFVHALKSEGYFEEDEGYYLKALLSHIPESIHAASGLSDHTLTPDGVPKAYYDEKLDMQLDPPKKETLSFTEALQHGFEDSGFGQAVVHSGLYAENARHLQGGWQPTADDFDHLDSVFKGDFAAQRQIVENATSTNHMLSLIAYEQERRKREEKAMNTDILSAGGMGVLLGSLANPVNFIPVVGIGARAANAVGVGFGKKLMSAAWTATQLGALNVADRYVGHEIGGIQYNKQAAFIVGAALGGGAEMLGYFAGKGFRNIEKTIEKVEAIQEAAALEINGIKVGKVTDDIGKAINEVDFMDVLESKGMDAAEALRSFEVNQVDVLELIHSFETEGIDIADALTGLERYAELEKLGAEQAIKAVKDARILKLLQDQNVLKTTKTLKHLKDKMITAVDNSPVAEKIPKNTRQRQIEKNQWPATFKREEGSITKKVYDEGNLIFMSSDKAARVLKRMGQKLPEDGKAFVTGDSNKIIVIKDRIKSNTDLENTIIHERIVHKGLDNLDPKLKDDVLKWVQKNIDNPKGEWNEALSRAGTTDPEEVLAYYAELGGLNKKNPAIMNKVSRVIRNRLRKLGRNTFDDDYVQQVLKEAALKSANTTKKGYILTSNGDAVVNGIRFSKESPLHPHVYDKYVRITNEIEEQYKIKPWLRRIASNKWIGSDFGKTVLSASKTMARIGGELFRDPYQLGINDALCAEHIKEQLTGKLQNYAIGVLDARNEWLLKKDTLHNFPGYTSEQLVRRFDEQCVRYYDATFGSVPRKMNVEPEIVKAAGIIKEMREVIIDELKHSRDYLGLTDGKNILKESFQTLDEGLNRITDSIKMSEFINDVAFKGDITKSIKFLGEYGYRAALRKIDANKKRYMSKFKIATDGEIDNAKFHEWLKSEADKWAYGHIDADASNIEGGLMSRGTVVKRKNPLSFLNDRFIADTSFELPMPDGSNRMFSFDNNLRDFRLDDMVDRMTNRTAGEIAFRRSFESDEDFIKQRATIISELKLAAKGIRNPKTGKIETLSQTDMDDIITTFDVMVSKLRGLPVSDEIAMLGKGEVNDLIGTLAKLTYTSSGNNIGIASLAEVVQSLHSNGMSILPRFVESFIEGTNMNELKNITRIFNLKDAQLHQKGRRFTSDDYVRRYGNTMLARGLDKVNGVLNGASRLTNLFNQLPRLTQEHLDVLRSAAQQDLIDAANGRKIQNFLYHPHEASYLREAGITTPEQLANLNADIKKYIPDEHYNPANFEIWRKKSPSTWWQFTKLSEDSAIRGLTRSTIGNTNTTIKSKALGRFASFFMEFTFKASHSQFLRMMTRSQKDIVLAGIFSMLGGGVSYIAYTQAMANTKYAFDKKKREEYLSKRFDRKMLTLAMLSRGAFLAPLAYGQNAAEVLGLTSDTVRTTTGGNISKLKGDNIDSLGALTRNMVNQMPIANQVSNMGSSVYNLAELAAFKASNGKYGSTMNQREANQLLASMPFGNFFGTQLAFEALKQEMRIPQKERKGSKPIFRQH